MIKKIIRFFDKLEDKTRSKLSQAPLVYALVGAIGVVLFWRGIWHTADSFDFLSGPISAIIGLAILLITGVFVSSFVGNRTILTGLKGEKKLAEKTKEEIETEESQIKNIEKTLLKVEEELSEIKSEIHHNHITSSEKNR
jgi:hypothetical protein